MNEFVCGSSRHDFPRVNDCMWMVGMIVHYNTNQNNAYINGIKKTHTPMESNQFDICSRLSSMIYV